MTVPKTAVHKDSSFLANQNEIWTPRKVAAMRSVVETKRPGKPTNSEFGLGIAGTYSPHYRASLCGRESIHAAFERQFSGIFSSNQRIFPKKKQQTAAQSALIWVAYSLRKRRKDFVLQRPASSPQASRAYIPAGAAFR